MLIEEAYAVIASTLVMTGVFVGLGLVFLAFNRFMSGPPPS